MRNFRLAADEAARVWHCHGRDGDDDFSPAIFLIAKRSAGAVHGEVRRHL
jgi:hypothetical protein